jgi:subtilisin family serine protease
LFFNPDGTEMTPGNLLFSTNGGVTLQKPDIAAADGVSTKTPGFLPFFGTSAAAPHAAGIAALIFSVRPGWTPAEVLNAIKSSALDSMAAGIDRDSGSGIAMAFPAVQFAFTH